MLRLSIRGTRKMPARAGSLSSGLMLTLSISRCQALPSGFCLAGSAVLDDYSTLAYQALVSPDSKPSAKIATLPSRPNFTYREWPVVVESRPKQAPAHRPSFG